MIVSTPSSSFLTFDGVNDFVANDASTPFVQWERTQAWTFFFRGTWTKELSNALFSSRRLGDGRGLMIAQANSNAMFVDMIGETGRLTAQTGALTPGAYTIQITYDGSSNANNVNFYINNVLVSKGIAANTLAGTITSTNTTFNIGRDLNSGFYHYGGFIQEVSFVNYVKSVPEMQADFTNGTQSAGSGSFLLRHLPRLGTISVNSLSYTDNGYLMNINGKSLPLSLSTDFTTIGKRIVVRNISGQNRALKLTKI